MDENGNFEAFTVDVSHPWFTAEQSQAFAQLMFEAWKQSAGHNANMLNGDYKQAAFGVAFVKEGEKLVIYVSNDFSLYEDYQNEVSDTDWKYWMQMETVLYFRMAQNGHR